mmetsp:Transcript_4609/g.6734  ORF Transcript_4609/g.6734 Transcript_4609/m.6734 type:complete len:231 (+) Transcript_4609:121-813(+)|eukprot:CAMPEP_0201685614 /NCGR_PEP_ID=MMETSP0578-20130828/327_1 /ASSEMBLY_ACC=CAM_ASM_000663 /TAXON_ID=267565 /ORGANISM="Skeletonema grethea, Strain CCMP 1804" /LENGTH=230 /DNA_ID=CAMNT_0048169547 /DNA_START=100 /DNA_END=792 /DNA_ORIENTATION=+
MVKYTNILVSALVVGSASAFAPTSFNRAARSSAIFMSEDAAPAPPEAPPAPVKTTAIVPVNEETVEFTAGLLGGIAGFAVGGPVLGAIGAAAANYASKTDAEVGEILSAVSKSSIEIFNYFSKLDSKYEVLDSAKGQLEKALEKVKSSESANPETIEKIESALSSTNKKISEINDEYDLVGTGMTALGVVGDLVEKAIIKAGELNEEYELSSKATKALSDAVDKAKAARS